MATEFNVVILVSKNLIRAAKVEGESVVDPIEMEWDAGLLRKAYNVIKQRYQTNRVRLILDDELSHTLDLEIPAATPQADERNIVAERLKSQIPEVLAAGDWDYKLKETRDDVKVMTVFVPVQDAYLSLTDAASKEGLEIEAVEPLSLSLARDPNPFVGMAKKTDLRGEDEQVLNLQPLYQVEESAGSLESVSPRKSMNKIVIAVVGVILLGLLAYGVMAVVRNTGTQPSPSPSPTPIATVTPSPSPTPEPVDLSALTLQVLNGGGVAGQAGAVAKLLADAGFGEAVAGNANSYDYTDTIVKVKSSLPETVYTTIVKALQPDYTVKKGILGDTETEYDVVVIVGKKASALGVSTSAPSAKPSVKPSVKPSATPTSTPAASPQISPSVSPSASASASPTI